MPTVTKLSQTQIDKVQIDEGLIFINYGEIDEVLLGPTRGGGEFKVNQTIRDVDFDGKKGKSKLQVIEEINATLKVTTLCCSQETLELALPSAVKTGIIDFVLTSAEPGLIPATKYLKNVVMFAKLMDGKFKKITIFSAMHEGDFVFGAKPKAENEHTLELIAHWDQLDATKKLYTIEEVASIPAN